VTRPERGQWEGEPVSWQMTAVGALMRLTRRRRYASAAGGRALLERAKGPSAPPASLARRFAVSTTRVVGHDVHSVRRHDVETDAPVVVYLHGGAYVSEIVTQHWAFIAEIATRLDVEVQVPIYGLAPEHRGDEAVAFVDAVLDRLAGRVCWLAGDSAGGGLALVAAQQRSDGAVRGVTLIAPWLDLGMSNPGIDEVEPHDPWLTRPGLRVVADAWAGDLPLQDPRVSPLHGRLEGLPPVDLWVGSRDITLPDCRLLRHRLAETGGDVTYHEEPGAIHVFPLLPVPEGRRARRSIVERMRAGLS
jgi:monoterpene epsilon-lactone hydrolase